jgi:hypothetical protein
MRNYALEQASDRIVRAVNELATSVHISTGDKLEEIWIGQKAYDTLSHVIMQRGIDSLGYLLDENADKWRNGKIVIQTAPGPVTARVK